MYKILVVDDEIAERDGVKYLIDEYKLPLEVAEATDGEIAWKFLQDNPVDILLTDIKMPFMDGLQLSGKARELLPELKIIIFSAYDQFEYAKEAIKLNVVHYILKPVILDEFLDVMDKVIQKCKEETIQKTEKRKLMENYSKIVDYEKAKVLLDILNGAAPDDDLLGRMQFSGIDFMQQAVRPVMIDFTSKFFDKDNDLFDRIKHSVGKDFDYVNLNEKQSVVFLKQSGAAVSEDDPLKIWNCIMEEIEKQYDNRVCIVVGQLAEGVEGIQREYLRMEHALDYKFFFDESVVLPTVFNTSGLPASADSLEEVIGHIYDCFDKEDYFSVEMWIDILVETIKRMGNLSSLFVKYTFTEIAKRFMGKSGVKMTSKIEESIDVIFRSNSIYDLKSQLLSIYQEIRNNGLDFSEEFNRRVIKSVLAMIQEGYMVDISLESIAEKVYLSPAYLSSIFKKETGQSLIKYLTSYRLEKALELIRNTNMKIAEIGRSVGYPNFSYFCWVFRTYFGMSPTKFREGLPSHE